MGALAPDDPRLQRAYAFDGHSPGSLLERLQFLPNNLTCYADYLRHFPAGRDRHVTESFLYWSKESLGAKPIVSVTHVAMIESRDEQDVWGTVGVSENVIEASWQALTEALEYGLTCRGALCNGASSGFRASRRRC